MAREWFFGDSGEFWEGRKIHFYVPGTSLLVRGLFMVALFTSCWFGSVWKQHFIGHQKERRRCFHQIRKTTGFVFVPIGENGMALKGFMDLLCKALPLLRLTSSKTISFHPQPPLVLEDLSNAAPSLSTPFADQVRSYAEITRLALPLDVGFLCSTPFSGNHQPLNALCETIMALKSEIALLRAHLKLESSLSASLLSESISPGQAVPPLPSPALAAASPNLKIGTLPLVHSITPDPAAEACGCTLDLLDMVPRVDLSVLEQCGDSDPPVFFLVQSDPRLSCCAEHMDRVIEQPMAGASLGSIDVALDSIESVGTQAGDHQQYHSSLALAQMVSQNLEIGNDPIVTETADPNFIWVDST